MAVKSITNTKVKNDIKKITKYQQGAFVDISVITTSFKDKKPIITSKNSCDILNDAKNIIDSNVVLEKASSKDIINTVQKIYNEQTNGCFYNDEMCQKVKSAKKGDHKYETKYETIGKILTINVDNLPINSDKTIINTEMVTVINDNKKLSAKAYEDADFTYYISESPSISILEKDINTTIIEALDADINFETKKDNICVIVTPYFNSLQDYHLEIDIFVNVSDKASYMEIKRTNDIEITHIADNNWEGVNIIQLDDPDKLYKFIDYEVNIDRLYGYKIIVYDKLNNILTQQITGLKSVVQNVITFAPPTFNSIKVIQRDPLRVEITWNDSFYQIAKNIKKTVTPEYLERYIDKLSQNDDSKQFLNYLISDEMSPDFSGTRFHRYSALQKTSLLYSSISSFTKMIKEISDFDAYNIGASTNEIIVDKSKQLLAEYLNDKLLTSGKQKDIPTYVVWRRREDEDSFKLFPLVTDSKLIDSDGKNQLKKIKPKTKLFPDYLEEGYKYWYVVQRVQNKLMEQNDIFVDRLDSALSDTILLDLTKIEDPNGEVKSIDIRLEDYFEPEFILLTFQYNEDNNFIEKFRIEKTEVELDSEETEFVWRDFDYIYKIPQIKDFAITSGFKYAYKITPMFKSKIFGISKISNWLEIK